MNYATQPGTIPHLAIEHLKTLPPGTKLSTGELAEAIGHTTGTLASCLRVPRDHGAVCSEQIPGSPAHRWWIPQAQQSVAGPTPSVIVKPVVASKPVKVTPAPEAPRAPDPMPAAAQQEPKSLRFGIFNDGCMSITVGNSVIELDQQETKQLVRFISRHHSGKR